MAAMACLMREAAVDRGRRAANCSRATVMCAGSKISVAKLAEMIDLSVSHPPAGCDICFKEMEGPSQDWRIGILATYNSIVSGHGETRNMSSRGVTALCSGRLLQYTED